jgi:hypothetical protein
MWVEFPQNPHGQSHGVFCDCSPTRRPPARTHTMINLYTGTVPQRTD